MSAFNKANTKKARFRVRAVAAVFVLFFCLGSIRDGWYLADEVSQKRLDEQPGFSPEATGWPVVSMPDTCLFICAHKNQILILMRCLTVVYKVAWF